jgi:hypothetical protein
MPESKNLEIDALNFKKVLLSSSNIIALRLSLRDYFRNKLAGLKPEDLNNPNLEKVDLYAGDKQFKELINKLIFNVKVEHVHPERKIINQSDEIFLPDSD